MPENLLIEAPDDSLVWDIWLAAYRAPALAVADEIGVFRELAKSPGSAEELAARMKLELRAVECLVGVFVPLGLVALLEGQFHLTEVARKCLLPESPFYWGPFLERVRVAPLDCAKLIDALKKGSAGDAARITSLWDSAQIPPERLQKFSHAMHSHSFALAVRGVPAMKLDATKSFLDVGGGSGSFSIATAIHHKGAKCTVMDLPPVCEVAREYFAKYGVEDRASATPVDMFKEAWPSGHDVVFFNDIFHDWDDEQCLFLARRAAEAVAPGGRVIAHEMLLDDTKAGPLHAATYSVVMLFAARGRQRSAKETADILRAAGLVDVRVTPTVSGYFAVEGRRKA